MNALRNVFQRIATSRMTLLTISLVLLALFVSASRVPIGESDSFWVAAAGREWLRTGVFPRENVFSFAEPHHPWVMHEWLFAIPYAFAASAWGPRGLSLIGLGLGTLTIGCALHLSLGSRRWPRGGALVALLLVFFVLDARLLGARPTYVSMVFPIAMVGLTFARAFHTKQALFCILLTLVWTNAHGSFPCALAILGIAWVFDWRNRARILALACSALATLVNPYGLALHRLVASYTFGRSGTFAEIHRHVLEYRGLTDPAYFVTATAEATAVLGVIFLVALWALWRRTHACRAVLALVFVGLGIAEARHALLGAMVGLVLLVPVFDEVFANANVESSRNLAWRPLAALAPAIVVGLGITAFEIVKTPRDEGLGASIGGAPLLRLARLLPPEARVFVAFRSAGVVIWEAAPVRVLYDARNDCYSEGLAQAAFAIKDGVLRGQELIDIFDRYNVDTALVPSREAIDSTPAFDARWTLLSEPDKALSAARWRVIASDAGYRIYVRPPRTRAD
jgi:hypothetical protein